MSDKMTDERLAEIERRFGASDVCLHSGDSDQHPCRFFPIRLLHELLAEVRRAREEEGRLEYCRDLAIENEREACAAIAEAEHIPTASDPDFPDGDLAIVAAGPYVQAGIRATIKSIAAAIRARGEGKP